MTRVQTTGLCSSCFCAASRDGYKSCQPCLDKARSRRQSNRSAGLCGCGRSREADKSSCVRCNASYAKFRTFNTDKRKQMWRKRQYRITESEFQARLQDQNNCCPLCTMPFEDTPCVDHIHSTGQIRELLCRKCNLALGHYEQYVLPNLQRFTEYLYKHGGESGYSIK